MAFFQEKIGWEWLKKRQNKKSRFDEFLPDSEQRITKKIAKKFEKLKNTITASFQAKIRWERLRKNEN